MAAAAAVKINLEESEVEIKVAAAPYSKEQPEDDEETKLDKFHYEIGLEYMENLFQKVIDHTSDEKQPAVTLDNISDPYERISKEFPFYRVRINIFQETMISLGKEDFMTLDTFQALFDDEDWEENYGPDSKLLNLLRSLPNGQGDNINWNSIICLSLLWCAGSFEDKF